MPLLPYLWFEQVGEAFRASIVVMVIALFVFGWGKQRLLEDEGSMRKCVRSGCQMIVMGGLAAAAAMLCVKSLNGMSVEERPAASTGQA